ncbi:fumarylacetoacetate hydrolase family protein [Gemmatimonas sp.]|uniref:fumarylacetoacetate hydrolase family protein n=1 Tax=Gemmatimonas sp. TaxID=1962908 RepID=UPI003342ADC0
MKGAVLCLALLAGVPSLVSAQKQEYVRYQAGGTTWYGRLDGETIVQLRAAPWLGGTPTGVKVPRSKAVLLAPAVPSKVIAVGLNYQTHLGERSAAAYPGLFAKLPTSIIAHNDTVILPPDANNVHYEGEMVIVMGKRAQNVSKEGAKEYVFGVTTGNDVSERDWQKSDLQWFRAKAADTFGPLGPVIVTGVNYDDLLLETVLNGKVVQSQRTRDLIFNVAEIVSYISRYVTLEPGDVIYSGTPGTTQQMKSGDVVQVRLENVGLLSNPVKQRAR